MRLLVPQNQLRRRYSPSAVSAETPRAGHSARSACADLTLNSLYRRTRIWSTTFLAILLGAATVSAAHGQAAYTAKRAGDLQAGGGFSIGNADYDRPTIRGGSFYASLDFKPHFGVELDFHQMNAPSPSTLYERSYEVGGRYVRHYGIFHPYARLMYGRGVFNYEYNVANLAYNMADGALGVDVNVTRRINIRADYEYQQWFSFRGNLNNPGSSTLSPQVFTIGAAYHFQ